MRISAFRRSLSRYSPRVGISVADVSLVLLLQPRRHFAQRHRRGRFLGFPAPLITRWPQKGQLSGRFPGCFNFGGIVISFAGIEAPGGPWILGPIYIIGILVLRFLPGEVFLHRL